MLVPGRQVTFGPELEPTIRLRNFHAPEDGFAWSSGRWCEILFDTELSRGRSRSASTSGLGMILDVDVFRWPPIFAGQNLLTYVNGMRTHSAYVTGRTIISVDLHLATLQPKDNVLTFDVPDAIRPSEFGLEDSRMLGVQIFSLGLEVLA